MLEWIMYPLSDWETICKRQKAIDWEFLPDLPLNEEELDFIEYYLGRARRVRRERSASGSSGRRKPWAQASVSAPFTSSSMAGPL